MNTKEVIIFIAVAIIIGVGTYTTVHMNSTPGAVELSTEGTSTQVVAYIPYENTIEGYTVMYPENLVVNQYEDGSVGFGTTTDGIMQNKAEVQVFVIEGKKGQTVEDAVTKKLQTFCDADGPGSSIRCTGAESINSASTTDGLAGFSFFLKGEVQFTRTRATSSITKGPFYVFPKQTGATGTSVVVIYPPFNMETREAETTIIEKVSKSLRLIQQ